VYYLNAHLFIFSAVPRASGPVFMFCAPEYVFDGADVGSCFHVLCCRTRLRRYRGRQLPFSCFARLNSFSAILTASSPIFKFCAAGHVFAVRRASGPVFMFYATRLVFGSTEGVGSRFHILRTWTGFRRYRGRQLPFSCFARSNSFSVERKGVGSRFHVLCPRTRFRRCGGRRVPFSYFTLSDSFLAVPRASGPILMFCAPELIFGGIEGVSSRYHVLRARTHFRRYRGRHVPFLCFAHPDSFSAEPRASAPVFMICVPVLVFGGTEGVGASFHLLRARTHFRWYRGCPVPFSCFALPEMFLAVRRA
jgi:hypothetical protein